MSTTLQRLYEFGTATFEVISRVFFLVFGFFTWLFSLAGFAYIFLAAIIVSFAFWGIGANIGTAVSYVEYGFRCGLNQFYQGTVRPILDGIIRNFFNPLICWWDAIVWFPYGTGREVIFPTARECGFVPTVILLGQLLSQFFRDWLVGYIASGAFLSQPFDSAGLCLAWQTFWQSWQNLLICSCQDLAPYFTDLPVIPAFYSSTQVRDQGWWDFLSGTYNGFMVIFQELLKFVRQFVYPLGGGKLLRPQFRPAFDFFCAASTGYYESWERAMQRVWDSFLPWQFRWEGVFCFLDKMTCIMLRSINVMLDIFFSGDRFLRYLKGQDFSFWQIEIKNKVREVLNLMAPPGQFATIARPLPNTSAVPATVITSYYLDTMQEATPEETPNPVFNQTRASECLCKTIERVFCDPLGNGTTCAQQFNGTVLATFDFCCITDNLMEAVVNFQSSTFELTLHILSINDLVVFLNEQPFTKLLKDNSVAMIKCLADIFLVVEIYGKCLSTVITEIANFVLCMFELIVRIIIALLSLFYYEVFLPDLCNLVTCPGDEALNEALAFLDRLTADTADSLINCLCFLLNTGFPVPPAGCSNCTVGGFIPPPIMAKRDEFFSVYNATSKTGWYASRLNPIYTYSKTPEGTVESRSGGAWSATSWWNGLTITSISSAMKAFGAAQGKNFDRQMGNTIDMWSQQSTCSNARRNAMPNFAFTPPAGCAAQPGSPMDIGQVKSYHERLVTQPPITMATCDANTVCFDLCCFPKSLVIAFAQYTRLFARVLNNALQSRNGNGSAYFDGTACMSGDPCFASDLTMSIVFSVAPLKCLCNFIMLVIPPTDFPDPCCFFTVLGEFVSCTLQVVINAINSAAGDPNFTYIKSQTGLISDLDIVLELILKLYDCGCQFLRIIISVVIDDRDLVKNFDPCCAGRKVVQAALELIRLIAQIALYFGTLEEPESQCYFYVRSTQRPTCVVSVNDLPIMLQLDRVRAPLLRGPTVTALNADCSAIVPPSGYNQNPGDPLAQEEGISSCICLALDALLAQVFKPDPDSTDPPGCPINACCVVYRFFAAIDGIFGFATRLIATFWQNWELRTAEITPGVPEQIFIPVEFIDFFFCDEYEGDTTVGGPLVGNVINPDTGLGGSSKCGRIEPALLAIEALLSECSCTASMNGLGNLLDRILRWLFWFVTDLDANIFPLKVDWPLCLCQGGPTGGGILPEFGRLWITAARQIILLVRNLVNPSYWEPENGSLTNSGFANSLVGNTTDIRQSWIYRFVAPFADVACRFLTNLACILNIIIGNTCVIERYNTVSSVVRYLVDAVIYAVSIIEAFVKILAKELAGQCIGFPGDTNANGETCSPTGSVTAGYGLISGNDLGAVLVSLLTFIFDAVIGVARFSCSVICPERVPPPETLDNNNTCGCLNLTPYVGIGSDDFSQCNLETCESELGRTCAAGVEECTLDDLFPGDPSIDPVLRCAIAGGAPPLIIFNPVLQDGFGPCKQCKNGCKNMTEPVVFIPKGPGSWLGNDDTRDYPWMPIADPNYAFGFACAISNNPPQSVIDIAEAAFGAGALLVNGSDPDPSVQNICLRETVQDELGTGLTVTGCVQQGWCKNDQLNDCGPGTAILDGIVIAAGKYLVCLLNVIFQGLGGVLEVLLHFLSFIWQISGGVIRMVVNFVVLVINFLQRPPIINIFLLIPDFLTWLFSFFAIFSQPVVIGVKRSVQSEIDSKMNGFDASLKLLFGSSTEHCINNHIKCFCDGLDLMDTVQDGCGINEQSTTQEVLAYVDSIFDNSTDCSDLIRDTYMEGYPAWENIPYSRRFEFVKCVARRSRGERWSRATSGFWPVEFFYSDDGYYRIWQKFRTVASEFVARETRRDQANRERMDREFERSFGADFEAFHRSVRSRNAVWKGIVENELNIDPFNPAYKLVMYADSAWYKWTSGYYSHIGKRAVRNMAFGNWPLGTLEDNIAQITQGVRELKMTWGIAHHHLNSIKHEARKAYDTVGKFLGDAVYNRGRNINLSGVFHTKENLVKREMPPFLRGLGNLFRRSEKKKTETSQEYGFRWAKNAQPYDGILSQLTSLEIPSFWPRTHWNAQVSNNYRTGASIFFRIFHTFWPHYTTKSQYERFILNGNCKVVDGAVKLYADTVDYCLNDYSYNLPNDTASGRNLRNYLETVSSARIGSRYNRLKQRSEHVSRNPADPNAWIRRRLITRPDRVTSGIPMDSRIYKRATQGSYVGGFDLLNWFVCLMADLFGIDFGQSVGDFFNDLRDWFRNPSTNPEDYPNVGFVYWATFPIRCEWPENMDCSIGIGLEQALLRVGRVVLIGVAVTIFVAPGLLALVGGATGILFVSFWVIVAVAWHYSPACLVMWPSFFITSDTSIPFWFTPISAFGFPMCMWDDIMSILDRLISSCYDYWLSDAWVNGNVCPTCPTFIDVPNCTEVGIDPIAVLLYWGNRLLGSLFIDIVRGIFCTPFFQWLSPAVEEYISAKIDVITLASDTQEERNRICSIIMLPSILLPLTIGLIAALFLIYFKPQLISLAMALFRWVQATPVYDAITGQQTPTGWNEIDGEDIAEVYDPLEVSSTSIVGQIGRAIEWTLNGKQKID